MDDNQTVGREHNWHLPSPTPKRKKLNKKIEQTKKRNQNKANVRVTTN